MAEEDFETEYLSQALEHLPGGVLVYRKSDDEILYANQNLINWLGCSSYDEMYEYTEGKFVNIMHTEDRAKMQKSIKQQIAENDDKFDHIEFRIVAKNGQVRFVEDYGHQVVNDDLGDLFYVFLIDSERKLLAYDIDELTGLPRLRRFLAHAERFHKLCTMTHAFPTYLYFDLSNFKLYNLSQGTESGDALLKEITAVLEEQFPNDFIAHSAEDRFIVLTDDFMMHERTEETLLKIDALRPQANVYAKAGIYRAEEPFPTPRECSSFAREACASVRKESTDKIVVYSKELSESLLTKAYVNDHLDEAIENGWIQPYLQPVVATESRKIVSCEALARWVDPKMGFLSPADFISTLEQSNQITKLDLYILEAVCKGVRNQIDAGYTPVPVSFNLSRIDFLTTDIFREVEIIRSSHGIDPRYLRLEITESMLLSSTDQIHQTIERFHRAGYQVWMDDFGSGYSSLNLLKDFEFDELKIDMVFLKGFSEKSKAIIESIVQMAKKIGISTLAEGVETEEQYEFLKSIGCDNAQGYLISKPVPCEELNRLVGEIGVHTAD